MSLNRLGGRPDIRIPNMMPIAHRRGKAEHGTAYMMKFFLLWSDWAAMFRMRLKAITALYC